MNNYTGYVFGVYALAIAVYGGLTFLWWNRLRRLRRQLQAEEGVKS